MILNIKSLAMKYWITQDITLGKGKKHTNKESNKNSVLHTCSSESFDKEIVVALTGKLEGGLTLLGVTDEGETLVEEVIELTGEWLLCVEDEDKVLLEGLTDSTEEFFLDCSEEEHEEELLVDCKDELGLLDELTDSHKELFLERFEEEDEEAFNFFFLCWDSQSS